MSSGHVILVFEIFDFKIIFFLGSFKKMASREFSLTIFKFCPRDAT